MQPVAIGWRSISNVPLNWWTVPQDVILETYEMMRPGRLADANLLSARAEMLRRDYGAHAIAALIDEAVDGLQPPKSLSSSVLGSERRRG